MLRLAVLGALLCIAAAQPPVPPRSWPIDKFVEWQGAWGSRTMDVRGLHLRIDLKRCGVDRPASEGCSKGSGYLVVTASSPGMEPVTIRGAPGVAQYVGIGPLQPNPARPSLILISDGGGSAGCVSIDVAVARKNAYRAVRMDPDPANHGTICDVDPAKLPWPADLTGHGRSEFLLPEAPFHCELSSCAASWNTKRVVALDGDRSIDVSDDPTLDPLYRADLKRALHACEHRRFEAAGACAGYAFDAARLGQLAEVWPAIDAQVARGCRVANERPCAEVDRLPLDLHERLAKALGPIASRQNSRR